MTKITVNKEKFQYNPFKISNKQPGFRYRWVDEEKVDFRMTAEGWTPVEGEEAKKMKPSRKHIAGNEQSSDTTLRVGKSILMKVPESVIKERDDFFAEEAQNRITNVKESLKGKIEEKNAEMKKVTKQDKNVEVIGDNKKE